MRDWLCDIFHETELQGTIMKEQNPPELDLSLVHRKEANVGLIATDLVINLPVLHNLLT
jgi:hypothetical protein